MNYLIKFFNNIRPWELITASVVCAVFFAVLEFFFVLGCSISIEGNTPCSLISQASDVTGGAFYFTFGWFQLLILFLSVLFIYKRIVRKRNIRKWKKSELIIYIFLSFLMFKLVFNVTVKTIDSFTYRDKDQVLENWIVDCRDIIVKTPLFTYDPNKGGKKNKTLYMCTYRYNNNQVLDIFGHEIKLQQ